MWNELEEIEREIDEACDDYCSEAALIESHSRQIADEYKRVAAIDKNPREVIDDIDRQFKRATELDEQDIAFLFLATGLQCVRQYVLTAFPKRLTDKEAAQRTPGHEKEHSDRSHRLYCPSLEEVVSNPVPFDVITGSSKYHLGMGGTTHRSKTLGHDPIFGWIFGTANIATSTVTLCDITSYHVKTGFIGNGKRDIFSSHADTRKVLKYTGDKLLFDGMIGRSIVGASVIKEAIHLKSDIYTKTSLPIPGVSMYSPELANNLAKYGIDMGNILTIGKQAAFSVMINSLVAMIHGMFYDASIHSSWSTYSVKTKKILLYSSLLASGSNVIYTVLSGNIGYLDVGGLAITLYRLITDPIKIRAIKREFLSREFQDRIVGNEYDFIKEKL